MIPIEGAPALGSAATVSWSWEGLDLPKKATLIRVRWPFTILCSCLLLYSENGSLSLLAIHGFVLLYLLSNCVLYFLDERLFDSFYFFTPLVALDTLFLTASLAVNGKAGADFYIVCFATIFLCCICRDMRGLIGVAVLSPLLYGYFLLRSANTVDPTLYLRLFFPFVIALFYGYFAQVERLQARLKKQTELAASNARFSAEAETQAAATARLRGELAQTRDLLHRSSRVKEEFLGVMSHELRTPLNVVMGYARLLNERVLGDMNPMQAEAVAKIMSRAKDQLTMITDVLEIASIESGESLTSGYEVSLSVLLDDLKTHYEVPERKEVVIVWDYPADLPIVKTDAEKLKHALQNLINNALKFTHIGVVTISVRVQEGEKAPPKRLADQPPPQCTAGPLQADLAETGNKEEDVGELPSIHASRREPVLNGVEGHHAFVEFAVTDTGIGIPKEHLAHIFDSFHQLDSSDTRRYGGVGMGLYVVKKLAEILCARLQVTSAPGQGSTFTLSLPYQN
ncbi:MAG: sensor histidine kinase [Candidatus Binatia bacterium]